MGLLFKIIGILASSKEGAGTDGNGVPVITEAQQQAAAAAQQQVQYSFLYSTAAVCLQRIIYLVVSFFNY